MKIAIATVNDMEGSSISELSGESPFYRIYSQEGYMKTLRNPFIFDSGLAGTDIALLLAANDVEVVICKSFDKQTSDVLKKEDIDFLETDKDKIEQVLKRFF